jgi:hypothetical protein
MLPIARSVLTCGFSGRFPFLQFRSEASGGGSEAGDSGTDDDGEAGLVKRLGLMSGGFHVDDVYMRFKLYVAVVNIV